MIERPNHYFIVESIEYTDDEVKDWFDDTNEVGIQIRTSESQASWPKNRNSCQQYGGMCQFWKICSARNEEEVEAALLNFDIRE